MRKNPEKQFKKTITGMGIFLGFGMLGIVGHDAITPEQPTLIFPKHDPEIVINTITGKKELIEKHEREKKAIEDSLYAIKQERDKLYSEKVSRGETERAETLKKEKIIQSIRYNLQGVFKGKEKFIYTICKGYEVNPYLVAAIFKHETKNGISDVVKNANNPAGLNWFKDCGFEKYGWYQKFPSLEVGIEKAVKLLKENYIDKGLNSIDLIALKYAPPNDKRNGIGGMDNKTWPELVTKYYYKIRNDAEG